VVDRDLVLAKLATMDRCIARIGEVRDHRQRTLLPVDVQDITVLNLQRAIQAAIDLAAHVVATEAYGLPDTIAANFVLLQQNGVLDASLADQLRRMVGFRNIAVHNYQDLDQAIVAAIVSEHLDDLRQFGARILERFGV
jgi:uncharacterized protein YutE (UPF0331/DUF86 family)